MKLSDEVLAKYELIKEEHLNDIHSEGLYLKHIKSGARICVASNDDENKVFYIAFRTPPTDSTGVPHIIEHTVLCGSEKFPVKDPFIELLKGSMNTFLNAMTYPDKTMYPVASCNDKDFQNLMDVYMDSVLHPNIYKEQNIFRQEGWHYELDDPDGELKINGVVYNEMKGAFSSGDSVLERAILGSLYPDTPYSVESGGDPDVIPELTYEAYLDFHRTFYHPSNSYIYLYGNMNVEEKLNWLDQAYLSDYDYLEMDSAIPMQKAFDAPAKEELYYSISSNETEDHNTYLSCNWSVGNNFDMEKCIAMELLDFALLSSQGAPVKQALLKAGIGEDVYGGYDNGTFQPYFSIVAKNADADQEDQFLEIITNVLKEQADGGLDKTTLLAAINGSEFKCREGDFGRFPKGLMYGIDLMCSWLYDDDQPFLHVHLLDVYASLRKKLDTDYFEKLIQSQFLDNMHCSYVKVCPQKGLTAQKEAELKERLAQYKASLTKEEVEAIIETTKQLTAYQEEPSSKEDLEKIPLLTRADMKQVTDPHKNTEETVEGLTYLWHDYETNGIIYLDYVFDAHHISEDLLPYMGILKSLMGKLDNGKYSYKNFSDDVNLYTGGIGPEITVLPNVNDPEDYIVKYEIRIKTLAVNFKKAVELARSMTLDTLFTDEDRIYEVLTQMKSRVQSDLSEAGHTVSAARALSYMSNRYRVLDRISGISQFRVLEEITNDFDQYKAGLIEKLKQLVNTLFTADHMLISVTGDQSLFELVKTEAATVRDILPKTESVLPVAVHTGTKQNEGFMDASQIQYVSLAGNFRRLGLTYHNLLRMFRIIMNYDYLWNNIRVKGGAYGCGVNYARTGELFFYSYRDPNLEDTVSVYNHVAEYLREFDVDERTMTKYVIGTFNEMDAPLTPITQGRRSLLAYLSGTTREMLQQERDAVLKASVEDIRQLADFMETVVSNGCICAIGNEGKLEASKDLFDRLQPLVTNFKEA